MIIKTWRCGLGWLGVLLLAGSGCGGKGYTLNESVEGTVKLDGTPLAGVGVQFIPEGAERLPTSNDITDDQGHYKLTSADGKPGAVIGKHRVVIHAGRGGTRRDDPQASPPPEGEPAGRGGKKNPPIPAKYTLPNKTDLEVEVTPDEHDYPLNLKAR